MTFDTCMMSEAVHVLYRYTYDFRMFTTLQHNMYTVIVALVSFTDYYAHKYSHTQAIGMKLNNK